MITLVATILIVFSTSFSFAQDASKATFLQENPQAIQTSITGAEVDCQSNKAGIYACNNVNLTAFLSVSDMAGVLNTGSGEANDIWGWTDPDTGFEYALLGMDNGTMFIDLSSPEVPRVVGFLPTKTRASLWRDVKVYKNHAFIVADNAGNHGVQVFDLTGLRNLNTPVMLQETTNYAGIGSAHNIVINEDTGFAYAVGSNSSGNTCGGALHMINIQDPANPVFAGCFSDTDTGFASTGYTHDAQCVVYNGPDTEHQGKEICLGSNESHISISDVSDKNNPVALSKATYPKSRYIHQGWLSEDHRYFYQDDEGDESAFSAETRTIIWDLEDLDDPVFLGDFFSGVQSIDHNMYVHGQYLYQANYTSGLRIWDVADPANPKFAGFFDTYTRSDGGSFAGAWSNYPYFDSGLVIVSSIGEGLFVLNPKLSNATAIETQDLPQALTLSPPFPNPARDAVMLDVATLESGLVHVEIVNLTGQVVSSLQKHVATSDAATRIELDASSLSNGSYIVRVKSERGMKAYPLTILK